MKKTDLVTKSSKETQNIGKKIAQSISRGGVVSLYGELGSGKTTFTQGFAEELGITRRVNSPTFIIMRSYLLDSTTENLELKTQKFYHLDLYRINSERDIEGLGIKEIFSDPTNIIVIEWPEKLEKLLPQKRTNIYFTYLSENERSIIINEY